MNSQAITSITRALKSRAEEPRGAAVLIPLIPLDSAAVPLGNTSGKHDGSFDETIGILLEQRSFTLDIQPGEVCLPGGHIEPGETPQRAAVRETCEELCVAEKNVQVIGSLGNVAGPGGAPLWVFVGTIDHYEGTFSAEEVDHTFVLPLDWLLSHEPTVYRIPLTHEFPEGFPWQRIPGGRAYPWRTRDHEVPFYLDTDPLVWGITAGILSRFAKTIVTAHT